MTKRPLAIAISALLILSNSAAVFANVEGAIPADHSSAQAMTEASTWAPARTTKPQQRGEPIDLRRDHRRNNLTHPTQSMGYWVKEGETFTVDYQYSGSAPSSAPELWIVPIQAGKGGLVIDGTTLTSPYVFDAIGDPHTLEGALSLIDGPISQFKGAGAQVSVQEEKAIDITAIHQPTPQQYAQSE